ncbi:MAG: hypothetical protein HY706_19305 [Candidatus Hydrogenedentes bacterium]|nr:hypothetical protein [Candidatus Hydrogenedentota bacterium]
MRPRKRALVATLLVSGLAWAASAAPTPDQIKQATQQVLSQRMYQLDDTRYYRFDLSWLRELIVRLLRPVFQAIGVASPSVFWTIVGVLMVVLIALLVHMVYSFYIALRPRAPAVVTLETTPTPDSATLAAEAQALADVGNYADACRRLFYAALAELEAKRKGRFMSGLTNTEYLHTFRTPWVLENLKTIVDLLNLKWYRDMTFEVNDYAQCAAAFERLENRLQQET